MSVSGAREWFCVIGGSTSGPLTLEELRFLAARNRIDPNTRVRRTESGDWVAARSVAGLFSSAGAANESLRKAVEPPPQESSATSAVDAEEPPKEAAAAPADSTDMPYIVPPPAAPLSRKRSQRIARDVLTGTGIALVLVALLLFLLWLRRDATAVGRGVQTAQATGEGGGAADGRGATTGTPDGGWSGAAQGTNAAPDSISEPASDSRHQMPREKDSPASSQESLPGEESTDDQPEDESPPTDVAAVTKSAARTRNVLQNLEQPQPEPEGESEVDEIVVRSARSRAPRGGTGEMFGRRDSRRRSAAVRREGGTAESEEAVNLGLKWLAEHQFEDGRWSLHLFPTAGSCKGQCDAPGTHSDAAATGLALLPFLAAGHTHRAKSEYQQAVSRGLAWLVNDQQPDGSFSSIHGGRMYAHGQATIALCEALAMTRDRELRGPAERAVRYIVEAQHPAGGWRYQPRTAGDTSVFGWQILALQSARVAELNIPQNTFVLASNYLDSAQSGTAGGFYGYMPGNSGTLTMTAEGLLCREYLGWNRQHPGLAEGTQYLLANLPQPETLDMYYVYYATQVLHHYGGEGWTRWNQAMLNALLSTQDKSGHLAGSWRPRHGHDTSGGRVYMTALAVCTLEVYYRHARLYKN